jgi:hypothetical protein
MKSKSVTLKTVVSQSTDIVASDIDDEKVMMSIEKGQYYGLDPIATCVWNLMEKPVTVSDLIDALLLEFDVDRETCERDVLAFLEEIKEDGILQVES